MSKGKQFVVARLFFEKKGRMLALKRLGQGYSLPGGGAEKGETIEDALQRECEEEVGLRLKKKHLRLVHIVMERRQYTLVHVFFAVDAEHYADQVLQIREPHKFEYLTWIDVQHPPQKMSRAVKLAIKRYAEGRLVSELTKIAEEEPLGLGGLNTLPIAEDYW